MSTYSKLKLSGSTDGRVVAITSLTSPGDTIHTAVSGTTDYDEVWLWAANNSDFDVILNLVLGSGILKFPLLAKSNQIILPGQVLHNSNVISAFLDSNVDANTAYYMDTADFSLNTPLNVASPGVVNWRNHKLYAGRTIQFATSGALPTGLTAGTEYFVLPSGLGKNIFSLATSEGGTIINFTGFQYGVQTCYARMTVTIASPGVMTVKNHQFQAGQGFMLQTTGALPTNLNNTDIFYVISTSYAKDTFRFATTPGGSAVNTSGSQSGVHSIKPVLTISLSGSDQGYFYYPNHGLTADTRIRLATSGSLPTGLAADTDYYVCRTELGFNYFTLASTPGGSKILPSGSQSGIHRVVLPTLVNLYGFVNRISA